VKSGLIASLTLAAALLLGAQVADADDVFDRIVAVVDGAVITQSEVDLFARIRLVRLRQHDEARKTLAPAARNAAVENLVNQALIFAEARRLAFQQISESEIARQMSQFQKRFPSEGDYASFLRENELNKTDLERIFQRMLLCERFARDTVGVGVKIGDAMIQEFITRFADGEALRGKRPEDQREIARRSLFRQLFDVELLRWMKTLKKRAKLRILIVYR